MAMRAFASQIAVDERVIDYITSLVGQTRNWGSLYLGASPRASVALMRASQSWALMAGAQYVSPSHVKHMASAVLSHRLVIEPHARAAGVDGKRVVTEGLGTVEVPVQVEPG